MKNNPAFQIVILLFYSIAVILVNTITGYLILSILIITCFILFSISFQKIKNILIYLSFFTVLIYLSMSFGIGNKIYFMKFFFLNTDALIVSITVLIRLLLILSSTTIFLNRNDEMDFVIGLKGLFKPLKVFKLNIDKFSFTLLLALNFVETIDRQFNVIKKASIMKGEDYRYMNFIKKFIFQIKLIPLLLVNTLANAEKTAIALDARHLDFETPRSEFKKNQIIKIDVLLLIIIVFFLLTIGIVY